MAHRRPLYYKGNSIEKDKIPKPDIKEKQKRRNIGQGNFDYTKETREFERKQFATSECIWCGAMFPEGEFLILCPSCTNCQYCGLHSDCSDVCRLCGNQLPSELKKEIKRFVI